MNGEHKKPREALSEETVSNGPRVICFGCSKPTTLTKPICDDCMRASGQEPTEYCALCEAMCVVNSPVLPAKRGVHMTKEGGYAGKCTA